MLRVALNLATTNSDLLADGEVELRCVHIGRSVLDKLAVLDREIDGDIGTAADGCALTFFESTINNLAC